MQKHRTGIGTTGDVDHEPSLCVNTKNCPYCDHIVMKAAPVTTTDHLRLLELVSLGARLDVWLPHAEIWLNGIVTDNFDTGLWEIKDTSSTEDPQCYHLIHFQMKNLRSPGICFPKRTSWEGARFDPHLVS